MTLPKGHSLRLTAIFQVNLAGDIEAKDDGGGGNN